MSYYCQQVIIKLIAASNLTATALITKVIPMDIMIVILILTMVSVEMLQ